MRVSRSFGRLLVTYSTPLASKSAVHENRIFCVDWQTKNEFFIHDTAALNSGVGTASAMDGDADDTLTYRITAGNDDGKFAINTSTGQLTVAGDLDIATTPNYRLTVEVDDANGGTDTVRVTVFLTITDCAHIRVVPNYRSHPRLVRDCSILLTLKNTAWSSATLNWGTGTSIFDWDGVGRRSTDDQYVGTLNLENKNLGGTIPTLLAGLTDLRRLDLDGNDLAGTIPVELGTLEDLEQLYLFGNNLTGSIPTEFGNLRSMQRLFLYNNDLSGTIPTQLGNLTRLRSLLLDGNDFTGGLPTELGNLTQLESLYARDNQLTGSIPAGLANLTNLTYLFLVGNSFTGCIPAGLRDVANHDLDRVGLTDCTEP